MQRLYMFLRIHNPPLHSLPSSRRLDAAPLPARLATLPYTQLPLMSSSYDSPNKLTRTQTLLLAQDTVTCPMASAADTALELDFCCLTVPL